MIGSLCEDKMHLSLRPVSAVKPQRPYWARDIPPIKTQAVTDLSCRIRLRIQTFEIFLRDKYCKAPTDMIKPSPKLGRLSFAA